MERLRYVVRHGMCSTHGIYIHFKLYPEPICLVLRNQRSLQLKRKKMAKNLFDHRLEPICVKLMELMVM